jgi:putative pyruvate formate lyase activating enzyme
VLNINESLKKCTICPRECGVDRTAGEGGFCRAGSKVEVHSARLHPGEEPPISGTNGSGTIFFNHCNMRCVYCQNYRFSQIEDGRQIAIKELPDLMLSLEEKGAHNINLVTPTHYAAHIVNAVIEARGKGLKLPIVYNSSGYEKVETLHLLDGLIDVYLVDMRYGDNDSARKYSSCRDYVDVDRQAVSEMFKQVGNLVFSNTGMAQRGIIIRHLILPRDIGNTEGVFRFISTHISNETYISLMSQYYPAHKARNYHRISRRINREEYNRALDFLYKYGLRNGWVQEYMDGSVDLDFAGTNIRPNI